MSEQEKRERATRWAEALLDYLECISAPSPKDPDPETKYYSVEETAKTLQIGRNSAGAKIRGGEFGPNVVRISARKVLVSQEGLDFYMQSHVGTAYIHKRAPAVRAKQSSAEVGRI